MSDKTVKCYDCHVVLPAEAIYFDGLCRECHLDLMRHIAVLDRIEMEYNR